MEAVIQVARKVVAIQPKNPRFWAHFCKVTYYRICVQIVTARENENLHL
jgi:hypothetical protein